MTIRFRALESDESGPYVTSTSLQGYIDISYAELVEMLGEPIGDDGYKVDAEWAILFGSGQVATIYNYKDGRNYMGDEGLDKEDIRDWHIGGKSATAIKKVSELFPNHNIR